MSVEKTCAKCEAVYTVTYERTPFRDKDDFRCDCGHLMDKWNSTSYPVYKLKVKGKFDKSQQA